MVKSGATFCRLLLAVVLGVCLTTANVAAVVFPDCRSPQQPLFLESNNVYILDNCTVSIAISPHTVLTASCLSNVSVIVRGGSALPRLALTSDCVPTTVQDGGLALYVEVIGVNVTMAIGAPFLDAGDAGLAQNVKVVIKNSSIRLVASSTTTDVNVVYFGYAPFSNIEVRFEDSELHLTNLNSRDTSWIRFDFLSSTSRIDEIPPSSNISIQVSRCSIAVTINATSTWDRVASNARASTVMLDVGPTEITGTTIHIANTTLSNVVVLPPVTTVQSIALLPRFTFEASAVAIQSSARRRGTMTFVEVHVQRCTAHAAASESASLLKTSNVLTFDRSNIFIADVNVTHALVGYPLPFDKAARLSMVLHIGNGDGSSATHMVVRLHRVLATQSVFSGEVPIPSVLGNSTLVNAAADLIRLATTMDDVVVEVLNCTAFADVRNGTAGAMFGMTINSATASLLTFDKRYLVNSVSVTIRDSTVSAQLDLFGGSVQLGVTSGSAYALGLIVNATSVAVVLANVVVHQPGAFALRSSSGVLAGASTVQQLKGVTLYSLCALVISADPGGAVARTQPVIAAIRPELVVKSALSYVHIRITNCAVHFLGDLSNGASNVFAVSFPAQLTNGTIVLERISSGGDGGPASASSSSSSIVDLFTCMAGCILQDVTVRVSNAQNVGYLLAASDGTATFRDSLMDFVAVRATCPAHRPMTPCFDVHLKLGIVATPRIEFVDSILSVNGSWFSGGFASLVGSSAAWVDPRAQLVLGCSLWDASPLDVVNIGPAPRRVVDFPSSVFVNVAQWDGNADERHVCTGMQPTWTVTESRTVPVPPQGEPFPGAAAAAGANWVVGATSTVAAAVGSAALMALEAQSLVSVGQSVCAPPALRSATSGSRFLLSPFYALGEAGIILGNVGLLLAVCGAQWMLVEWLRTRQPPPPPPTPTPSAAPRLLEDSHQHILQLPSVVRVLPPPPEAQARWPNLSYVAGVFLLQGQLSTAVSSVFGGTGGTTPVGLVGLAAVGGATRFDGRCCALHQCSVLCSTATASVCYGRSQPHGPCHSADGARRACALRTVVFAAQSAPVRSGLRRIRLCAQVLSIACAASLCRRLGAAGCGSCSF